MTSPLFNERTVESLESLHASGRHKSLRHITGPMGPVATLEEIGEVVVLCSNNYLGLANHPEVVEAGKAALDRYGAGTASVRFICGTFDIHRELEQRLARLMGTEAALSYVSCWNANEALIPTIAGPGDSVFSDELNHASLIDAIRLARNVEKHIYRHNDPDDLEAKLRDRSTGEGVAFVVTDGVFSMEGDVANLPELLRVCRKYEAVLIVDDSHGTGVLGEHGRGTAEHFGLIDEVDIYTGTLGKALGGAAGGFVAAGARVTDLLLQRSRPSLFSNALPPTVAASAGKAIQVLQNEPQRVDRLRKNAHVLHAGLQKLGFEVRPSPSAILPIIIGDTAEAIAQSQRLLELGVWVVGFGYPVVPEGSARLRIQASAELSHDHIERVLDAFARL